MVAFERNFSVRDYRDNDAVKVIQITSAFATNATERHGAIKVVCIDTGDTPNGGALEGVVGKVDQFISETLSQVLWFLLYAPLPFSSRWPICRQSASYGCPPRQSVRCVRVRLHVDSIRNKAPSNSQNETAATGGDDDS